MQDQQYYLTIVLMFLLIKAAYLKITSYLPIEITLPLLS